MHVFVQSQNNILKTLFISHTQEGQRTFFGPSNRIHSEIV